MIWGHIHPKAKVAFQRLEEELLRGVLAGETTVWFRPFEGYREPAKQLAVYNAGTSKALPFQSPHQYGLAIDFVPFIVKGGLNRDMNFDRAPPGKWSWDDQHPWNYLDRAADRCGLLRPIKWDRPHVEHPIWERVKFHLI